MNDDLIFLAFLNNIYVNKTTEMRDYIRDPFQFDITTSDDKFYLGLYKPFNATYVEFEDAPIDSVGLTFRYSSSSGFQDLEVNDDTLGLSRSGFISWERNIGDVNNNIPKWEKSEINGLSLFWIEISFDSDLFSRNIKGWNIVFADDNDINTKSPYAQQFKPKNDISFIRYHVAARDEIVQTLRNGGYLKNDNGNLPDNFRIGDKFINRKNIIKWDILDFGEIRQAAIYKALSMIYFNDSRNVDDKSFTLYRQYEGKYGEAFKLFYLTLDKDDDGIVDLNEKLASNEAFASYE